MDILKKINKMRLDKNWSIYRLSIESGVSQSTLTNMFNRETLPSITTLECLCHAFGITRSDFFQDPDSAKKEFDHSEIVNLYQCLTEKEKESVLILLRSIKQNKK